ncbi:hypothetical protein ACL02T_33705 [Pseudonocardia sp. RS010]|uniref:hypothetical protein n=1 Tax=Pseudonocardia sp. RS010 TaxID=3385979 RepID=UPI00399F1E24
MADHQLAAGDLTVVAEGTVSLDPAQGPIFEATPSASHHATREREQLVEAGPQVGLNFD